MKASEVFIEMGNKLEQKYKTLGFKYSKNNRWVFKRTKEYEYIVSFSSFPGNTKNAVSLSVDLIINYRKLNEQLFFISLWKTGHFYNIGAEHTFEYVYNDIILHMENILLPFINKFENDIENYKLEWIEDGFLGKTDGTFYLKPSVGKEITNEKFLKEHNIFGYVTNLIYINEKFGKAISEKCFNSYYYSLNEETKIYFKKAFSNEMTGKVNDFSVVERNINVSIIKDAVKLELKIK
jgi:hypothetical protein